MPGPQALRARLVAFLGRRGVVRCAGKPGRHESKRRTACADRELEAMPTDHLRAGLQLSGASVAWTVFASTAAVALGIRAGSLVLVALDSPGFSTPSVGHPRPSLPPCPPPRGLLRPPGTVGFACGHAWPSDRRHLYSCGEHCRLIGHVESHAVPTGVALAAISIGVLGLLAVRKHRTAGRIPSRALLADGWLSATGCLLAMVTVTGTGLTSAYGWWWVDPLVAAAVACVALTVATVMARG